MIPGPMLGPILTPNLRLLFVGINPSLRSAEVGHHFARPGNRFWAALHDAGLTPRRLRPDEDASLPLYGLGVTNIAERPTRDAAQLSREELRAGAAELERTVRACAPRLVAMLGLTAYRVAFARPRAVMGLQGETIGGGAGGGRRKRGLPPPRAPTPHKRRPPSARLYAEAAAYAGRAD